MRAIIGRLHKVMPTLMELTLKRPAMIKAVKNDLTSVFRL